MQLMRLVGALLIVSLVGAACGDSSEPDTSVAGTLPATSTTTGVAVTGTADTVPPDSAPPGTSPVGQAATVVDLIDGDSLIAAVDGAEVEVRLLGMNAPERNTCFGFEARDRLAELLANGFVLVEDTGSEQDQFDRLLRYAYVGERNVGEIMVKEGFAIALASDHSRRPEFRRVYRQAVNTSAGMWGPQACGGGSPVEVEVVEVEFNPRGPDGDDLNGEWAAIQNVGATDADLSAWLLRDESSRNRYSFPDGFTLAAGDSALVRVGCGDDGPNELFWCSDAPVFNNAGDSAILQDGNGNVVDVSIYEGAG